MRADLPHLLGDADQPITRRADCIRDILGKKLFDLCDGVADDLADSGKGLVDARAKLIVGLVCRNERSDEAGQQGQDENERI